MLTVREKREEAERYLISEYGVRSKDSLGRERKEAKCPIRTDFQRDVDRISHSKAFRRLKHKTQVFLLPEGDHYRTRLTHTLEVSRIARTISRALMLNEDLTEAIALGHDIGHTPFGHAGERVLNRLMTEGFRHYEQSLRVCDKLENDGKGLNLCYETRMGILNHTSGFPRATLEADVVRTSDLIAYVNHDIDDAIRAGISEESDLPYIVRSRLGKTRSERIDAAVSDIVAHSNGAVSFSPDIHEAIYEFRDFMFGNIYVNPIAKAEEEKVDGILERLWNHYILNPQELPPLYHEILEKEGIERAVADFISGMTDSFAMGVYQRLFVPSYWSYK